MQRQCISLRKLKIVNVRIWTLCIFLLLPIPGPAAADTQNRVALVIGNTHYANAAPLVNPENDAHDMCAALGKLGFDVICKLDLATKREFKDAIYDFTGKINQNCSGLICPDTSIGGQSTIRGVLHDKAAPKIRYQSEAGSRPYD